MKRILILIIILIGVLFVCHGVFALTGYNYTVSNLSPWHLLIDWDVGYYRRAISDGFGVLENFSYFAGTRPIENNFEAGTHWEQFRPWHWDICDTNSYDEQCVSFTTEFDENGTYPPENICHTLTYPETCNCTSPLFPKPDYCGNCLWDYKTSTCLSIDEDIVLPAVQECQSIETETPCTAVSYCVWTGSACDYYKNLPLSPETTDPDFGILGNYIRDVMRWAFIPGQDVGYRWQELSNTISGKMPFGYFYLIKAKVLDISYASSTAPTITTTANFFGNNESFTFLDFTTLQNFLGSSVWSTIQALISLGLWFGLIFYIYHRIVELKL